MTRLDEHGSVGARLVVLPLIPLEHRREDHQRGGAFVEELARQIPPDADRLPMLASRSSAWSAAA